MRRKDMLLLGDLGEKTISDEEWEFYDYSDSISNQIAEYMNKNHISKSDLAKRLGKSKAFVSQILLGDKNLTMRTLTSVLYALGLRIESKLVNADDDITIVAVHSGGVKLPPAQKVYKYFGQGNFQPKRFNNQKQDSLSSNLDPSDIKQVA